MAIIYNCILCAFKYIIKMKTLPRYMMCLSGNDIFVEQQEISVNQLLQTTWIW